LAKDGSDKNTPKYVQKKGKSFLDNTSYKYENNASILMYFKTYISNKTRLYKIKSWNEADIRHQK
jgi:hypothetical protein